MNDLAKYGLEPRLQEVFDHSFSGTYEECQRMAYYQGVLGRAAPEDDYALVWGSVFHKLAELWLVNGSQLTPELVDLINEVITLNIPEDIDDRYGRNRLRMQEAFIAWAKFRIAEPIKVLRTEQPATVACLKGEPCIYNEDGCGLTYGGKQDQIVQWNVMTGPLDIKTTTQTENDPIQEYKPNHQMEGYVWIASHLMGIHCWGVIVERAIINKSKIDISRFPVPYTRDAIREWAEGEVLRQAEIRQKFIDHPTEEIYWRQNQMRCFKPYRCRFRDVCLSPRDANFRLKWLRDNTRERRFDFRKLDKPTEEAT
jgi:hypothetical protein